MKQIKFLIVFFISISKVLAQGNYHESQEVKIIHLNRDLKEIPSADKVKQLAANYLELPQALSLELMAEKRSRTGTYYTFFLSSSNIRIYNHQVKVFIRSDAQLRYIMHNISPEDLQSFPKYQQAGNYSPRENEELLTFSEAFFRWKDRWESVKIITLKNKVTQLSEEVAIGNGDEIFSRRIISHESGDSGVIKVFFPDPLTSAGVEYDTQQMDTSFLNSQLFYRKVPVEKSNDTLYLRNDRMYITDLSSPLNNPFIAVGTDTFNTQYKQMGLNDVMVYYHINRMVDHVHDLGYNGLPAYQLQVDPYALANGENSMFTYTDNPPSLQFGKGQIYDAEDADVIIHELAHALSHSASPGTDLGLERLSIEEGQADYFAASYSKRISTYNWQKVFNWDGTAPGWKGRTVTWPNNYPANGINSGAKWTNGQYWSAAMMRVWDSCGGETADILMLEALHSLMSNMKMPQLAEMVLEADSNLFGGSHTTAITCAFFYNRILLTEDSVWCPPRSVSVRRTSGDQPTIQNSFAFAQGNGMLEVLTPGAIAFSSFEIYDIQGRKIVEGPAEHNRLELSPAIIKNPGIYFLRIYYRDHTAATVKIARY